MGGYLGMCCVMRVFCLITCFLATHLFLIGNPWASRYGKIHNVFLFSMPFLKTCILWMWNLSFYQIMRCLIIVWNWNLSQEHKLFDEMLLHNIEPACLDVSDLCNSIVKFLLLISKKINFIWLLLLFLCF